jgi:hypothetical protein
MATFAEDLAVAAPEVDSFEEKNIVGTGYPLIYYIQELLLAFARFIRYKPALEAGKMDFLRVEKLKILAGACRELYSIASVVVFPSSAIQKRWEKAKEEAEYLLYFIKEAGVYACREHADLLAVIHSIYNEGGSNSNMIQDLNDYAVFGREHADLFTAAGYDLANFQRAAELAREMDELLAQATLDKSDSPENRIRRDKAFTLAKKLVDDLNAQARFIYTANRKIATEFAINPPRKKPAKKEKVEEVADMAAS